MAYGRVTAAIWLVLCIGMAVGQLQVGGIVTLRLKRSDNPVMDLTGKTIRKKDRIQLARRIRSIPEDVQIVVADDVQAEYYTTKEMAVKLFNKWPMGDEDLNYHGILILVVMDQNRIEIEFGDGLNGVMDADWCQEMLITKVVPWFRQRKFAKGMEEALMSIDGLLKNAAKKRKKKIAKAISTTKSLGRKGMWASLLAVCGLTKFAQRFGWIGGGNIDDDAYQPPPPRKKPSYKRPPRHRREPKYFRAYNDHDYEPFFMGNLGNLFGGRSSGPSKSGNTNINIGFGSSSSSARTRKPRVETSFEESPLHHHSEETVKEIFEENKSEEYEESDSEWKKPTYSSSQKKPSTISPAFVIRPQQDIKSLKDVISEEKSKRIDKENVHEKPTSNGAGASWSTVDARAKKESHGQSSGHGGGASWSTPSKRSSSNNNNVSGKSSGKGGGASW